MSQKDKKQILRDKIIEVLRRYGALSTHQVTKIVNKEHGFRYNKKTIERRIAELKTEGKVVPNPPMGREQTYSASRKPRLVSEFFINQFWKNLDVIRNENASKDSLTAFFRLRSLIKMYPELFEELKLDIEKTQRIVIEQDRKLSSELLGTYAFGSPDVENLIGRVSAFLHKQFERLQRESKEKC